MQGGEAPMRVKVQAHAQLLAQVLFRPHVELDEQLEQQRVSRAVLPRDGGSASTRVQPRIWRAHVYNGGRGGEGAHPASAG